MNFTTLERRIRGDFLAWVAAEKALCRRGGGYADPLPRNEDPRGHDQSHAATVSCALVREYG